MFATCRKALCAVLLVVALGVSGLGQNPPAPQPPPAQPPAAQDDQKKNQQNTTPEAGGPQGDIGPIAVPKKKDEPPRKEDNPKPKKAENTPEFSLRVNVPVVNLEVGVMTKDGMFVPGLKKEYFRVLEDGVPQTITNFGQIQAPITVVLLVEFANNPYFYNFQIDSINASYVFTQSLKKDDWVALISFDLRPHILQDFTQDKRAILGGLSTLQPGMSMSSETDLFDALYDTIDRLEGLEGRKYIVLLASGRDTFSKRTYDQALKKIQGTKDIVIYSVGTGQALRNYLESRGLIQYLCPITDFSCSTTYLQADNAMRTFAKMTGGKAYFPLFQAQFRENFGDIGQTIRSQYSISYHPTNRAEDGSFRKIKVELVDETGKPLVMHNEKGKNVKYQVIARDGYKAKQQVE